MLNDLGKETSFGASQVALVVKNLPTNAGDLRDGGLIPGSGRSPGGGHGNPVQYSHLENPMDTIGSQSQTQLKGLSMHALKEAYFVSLEFSFPDFGFSNFMAWGLHNGTFP